MLPLLWLFLLIVVCPPLHTSSVSKNINNTNDVPIYSSDLYMGHSQDRTSTHTAEPLNNLFLDPFLYSKKKLGDESKYYEVPVSSQRSSVSSVQNVLSRKMTTKQNGTFPSSGSNHASNNNNQNVLHLVRNIDARLRNIRNIELLMTSIQEIFDSMDFTSSSSSNIDSSRRDASNNYSFETSTISTIAQNLETVSKRLSIKLQKATHVVLELREFFLTNITNLIIQKNVKSYETNENNSMRTTLLVEISKKLFLNTFIECCEDETVPNTKTNYNKDQIEILNILKTDTILNKDGASQHMYEYSFEANRNIVDKLRSLHSGLSKSKTSLPVNVQNSLNVKLSGFFKNNLKHIFFLSSSDQASDHNAPFNDFHLRRLYVSAVKHKFIFLLIDVGSALSTEQLDLTKSLVLDILKLLSDTDMITVVTVSGDAKTITLGKYMTQNSSQVYFTTRDLKEDLINSVNNVNLENDLTNHTLGFQYSFKLLKTLQSAKVITSDNPIAFMYITRGHLTNLSDAMHVLSVIAEGQSKLLTPIIINTCAVVTDERLIMYEKQFLRDVSHQNYTKYNINVSSWNKENNFRGHFFVINKNHPELIIRSSMNIFENFFHEPFLSPSLEVHEPVVDYRSKDTIVSLTHAVSPFGVVGVNLYLSDLVEDIFNYNSQGSSIQHTKNYAFLIDKSGRTIAHPAIARPSSQRATPYPVDIVFLENSTDFISIRQHMLHNENGNLTTTVHLHYKNDGKFELLNKRYIWKEVLGMYIICFTTTSFRDTVNEVEKLSSPELSSVSLQLTSSQQNIDIFQRLIDIKTYDLLYHRIDLIPPKHSAVCRYFRQIGTLEVGTIFLSSRAFDSPFAYLQSNRNSYVNHQLRTVESIMAYIKDNTGLLANPGLRAQVRNDISLLYRAMYYLKKRHQDPRGTFKNYIIRRYISTINGVLQVYPGCLLSNTFDPISRPWFKKAMHYPGKIIVTEPYIDAGGAGYIISIAHTIFEGKSNALHSVERDNPVAIVALDVQYTFFYKLVMESTPVCGQSNIKCLLFENEGYLIAHPSMLEPSTANQNQRRPHEHITHKESFLANDILNHKKLVRKLACVNYQNRTIQRYYIFNTSVNDILTNVVQGERTKYGVTVLRGSNIFAAVLNSTCDGGAFCPCSTINRICLNCNRMDQTDCECPCECPMDMNDHPTSLDMNQEQNFESSPYSFTNYTHQYPYCDPSNENLITLPSLNDDNFMPPCIKINCDTYGTQIECLAVIGCEWCQLDIEGNVFTTPFCTSQMSCFNGVLAAMGPYDDDEESDMLAVHVYNTGQKQNSYSALGPVTGAIIVLVLIIGFAIYCYGHNTDSNSNDNFYVDSLQDNNYGVPLTRLNIGEANEESPGCGSGSCGSAAHLNLIQSANISPYHMSSASSYNRPPIGESDHGYSTMTPHDDYTDHQSFTLVEPLLLNDKRNSKSDTMSISTSISSPTKFMQPHCGSYRENNTWRSIMSSPIEGSSTSHAYKSYNKNKHPAVINSCEEPASLHHILAPVTVHRHMELTEA